MPASSILPQSSKSTLRCLLWENRGELFKMFFPSPVGKRLSFVDRGHCLEAAGVTRFLLVPACLLSWPLSVNGVSINSCVPSPQHLRSTWPPQSLVLARQVAFAVTRNRTSGCFYSVQCLMVTMATFAHHLVASPLRCFGDTALLRITAL